MFLNQYVNQEYINRANREKEANIPRSRWSCKKCQGSYSELILHQTRTADIWYHGKKVTRKIRQNLITTDKNVSVGGEWFATFFNYSNYSAVGSSALLADRATKHC